jgi:hypothetical protein
MNRLAVTHRFRRLLASFAARIALIVLVGLAAAALAPASAMAATTGTIEGTVKGGPTQVPLNEARVCPWLQTSEGHYEALEQSNCASTAGTGHYSLELPEGEYALEFTGPGSGQPGEGAHTYVTRYSGEQASLEKATALTVKSGSPVVSNAVLEEGGWITGTVTDGTTHTGAENEFVCAAKKTAGEPEFVGCVTTESGGRYAIWGLAAGEYLVEFLLLSEQFEFWLYDGAPVGGALSEEAATPVKVMTHHVTEGINTTFLQASKPPAPPVSPLPQPLGATTTSTTTSSTTAGTASGPGSATVKNGSAAITLRCTGGPCNGTLKLLVRVTEKLTVKRHGKSKKIKRIRNVVIGESGFAIGAGESSTVDVHLTGKGRTLLTQAGKKGLKVTLSGSGVQGGTLALKESRAGKHGGKK